MDVIKKKKKKKENNVPIIYYIRCLQLVEGYYGGLDDRVNGNIVNGV